MIKVFKNIAFWEGVSLIALLFIAMPLKYKFHNDILVKYVGMAHGLLFILYLIFATFAKAIKNWDLKSFIFIILLSLIPFGTFYMEKKYL